MGRPKKQPAARRTEQVCAWVTAPERLRIERDAARAALSVSAYLRRLALSGRVIVNRGRALDHATFDQIRRIGVNLNQLARLANQTGRLPPGIAAAAEAVERLLARELAAGPASAPAAPPAPPPDTGPGE